MQYFLKLMFAIKENVSKYESILYILFKYRHTIFGIFDHYCGNPRSTIIARKYVYNASKSSVHLLHATSAASRNKIR